MQKKERFHFFQKEIVTTEEWQIGPSECSYIFIPHFSQAITCQANQNTFDLFYMEEKQCYYLKPNKKFIFKTKEKQNCYLIEIQPTSKEFPSIPLD